MNFTRIALATLASTAVYFVVGGVLFMLIPFADEIRKYPSVYRPQDDYGRVMPLGMLGLILSMLALAVMYALFYRGGAGLVEGARFGALVGAFAAGSFFMHNYVSLNIGLKLTVLQAASYFLQWMIVGVVIGLIYRPLVR